MITSNELKLILSKIEDIKDDLKDEIKEVKDQNKTIIDTMVTVTACKESRNNCMKPQEISIKRLSTYTGIIAIFASIIVNVISTFFK